jgi:hypothetical protein
MDKPITICTETARILDALSDTERLAELTAQDAEMAETASQHHRDEMQAATQDNADPERYFPHLSRRNSRHGSGSCSHPA